MIISLEQFNNYIYIHVYMHLYVNLLKIYNNCFYACVIAYTYRLLLPDHRAKVHSAFIACGQLCH